MQDANDLPTVEVAVGPEETMGVYVYWQRGGWAVAAEERDISITEWCFGIVNVPGKWAIREVSGEYTHMSPLRPAIAAALVLHEWNPSGTGIGATLPPHVHKEMNRIMREELERCCS